MCVYLVYVFDYEDLRQLAVMWVVVWHCTGNILMVVRALEDSSEVVHVLLVMFDMFFSNV